MNLCGVLALGPAPRSRSASTPAPAPVPGPGRRAEIVLERNHQRTGRGLQQQQAEERVVLLSTFQLAATASRSDQATEHHQRRERPISGQRPLRPKERHPGTAPPACRALAAAIEAAGLENPKSISSRSASSNHPRQPCVGREGVRLPSPQKAGAAGRRRAGTRAIRLRPGETP